MTTPLQLDGYIIDTLLVEPNVRFDPENEGEQAEPTASARHLLKEGDAFSHQLVLRVEIEPGEEDVSTPYRIAVIGRAFFTLGETDQDEEAQARLVVLNGSAILLGMLRSQVAQVTALGRWGTFLIPAINLVEALKNGHEAADETEPAERAEDE